MESVTKSAFASFGSHDYYQAQFYFRLAVKVHPCWETFQNLGVFYEKEGLQLHNGRGRCAPRLAEHYLLKAQSVRPEKRTLWALGYLYSGNSKYEAALECFSSAFAAGTPDAISACYCASICNQLARNTEMLAWSRKAMTIASQNMIEECMPLLAFALLFTAQHTICPELDALLDGHMREMPWERFVIFTLAGSYDRAASLVETVWRSFSLNLDEMALLFQCCHAVGNSSFAAQCCQQRSEQLLEADPSAKKKQRQLRRLYQDSEYRLQCIAAFRPQISLPRQDCYAEKWDLKIEGLNVPMPPEQLAAKKKR